MRDLLLLFPGERVLKQSGPLFVLHLAHHCLLRDHKRMDYDDGDDDDDDFVDLYGNPPFDSKLFTEGSDDDDL